MKKTLAIVCVHYDANKLPQTIQSVNRILDSLVAEKTVFFVANHETVWKSLNELGAKRGECSEVLHHDNSGMEFGAYQAGLDRVLNEIDPEWVLFANDTFAVHHPFGKVHREKLVMELHRSPQHSAIIGQVASLPRSYAMDGLRTHRWMTTNLFALNRAALKALNGKIYVPELEALVTETSEMTKFFPPNIDKILRDHLEAWLFLAHAGWHWYASEPLTTSNAAKMARKARSILQEKYLAARLEQLGAEFINLNDLSVARKVLRELERKIFVLANRGAK